MNYPSIEKKKGNAMDGGFKPTPRPPVFKHNMGAAGYVSETLDGTFMDMNRDPRLDVKNALAFLEACKRKAVSK